MKANFSRFVQAMRMVMVMMMGATMLATSAVIVHAGPSPSLTASQNPVMIAAGQPSGQFTLSWNSGSGEAIELWGSHNGGPDVGPFPAAGVGSSPETIKDGETVLFKMYTPKKQKLLASLNVTTKHADQIDNSCAEQCIKSVTVEPHGTFANFHIITTHPVKVTLEAYEPGKSTASATFNLTKMTDWNTQLLNLKPGTKYTYDVKATDDASNTKFSSGPFTTLRRQVQVNFTDIHVIDDSDALSAGDLIFWFNVNGKWNQFLQFPSSGEASISSGDTVHPFHVETLIDAPDDLSLAVYGWDDDCDFFDGLCTDGIGPGGSENGSDSEGDWATAKAKTNVALSGLSEEYSDTLSFQTTQFNLQFSVKATYAVSYVP